MSRLIAAFDWSSTPLGPADRWPHTLRTTVGIILRSPVPIVTLWGEDGVMIYNDAYSVFAGGRHPRLLGSKVREGWPEVADFNDNVMKVGLAGGTLSYQDQELTLHRTGAPEQVWMNLDYSPIRDGHGMPIGVISIVVETSAKVRAERGLNAAVGALQVQTEQLRIVNEAGSALAAELDVGRVTQLVTDAGVALTGAQFGAFFYNVQDEENGSYMLYTLSGVDAATFAGYPMPRNTAIFAPTFSGECLVRSDDITRDPRYGRNSPHAGMPEGHLPVRSYLAVPVKSRGGEVLGGLFFGHSEPGRFGAVIEASLVSLASQAAIAMDNARLFQSVQQENRRRAEAEAALRDLNASLEQEVAERTAERDRMWRLSADIMLVARFDTTIAAVNPAWTALLGWAQGELIGRPLTDLVHPDDHAATLAEVHRLSDGNTTFRFENRCRRKDGGYRRISWAAVPESSHIHAVGRDVTAEREAAETLRRTEAALQQAQKMEAIGQLTGGVAHDFNNLLQVISGNLQLLSADVAGNSRAERRRANALAGAQRGAKLASQLLAFGRRQALEPKVINIGRFVTGMDDMLRRSIGEGIEIETIVSGGLWNTLVDPTQVENALLNLAINARDAMEGNGKLTIEVGNAYLDDAYVAQHADAVAGQYVMLAVTDTGSGMPPDVMAQVFEPFFSTKPEGKGTGLGLSMVYGFVKQSGGHVKLYSEAGQGTTVKLYFPRAMESEDRITAIDTGPITGGTETILVAEDDEAVRATVVEMLGDLGYRVLQAKDAERALAVLESGVAVDLLFTDVVMPGPLKSAELARKARERQPGLAVLFTSGYTENGIVHAGRLDPGLELLSKPYSREALARKLRHVLANQSQLARIASHAATPPAQPAQGPAPVSGGAGPKRAGPQGGVAATILLVEDDALIRMSTADLLLDLGHAVLEASSAEEALALLRSSAVDVVITDLGLPGMSGAEFAGRAQALHPDLGIVIATGSAEIPQLGTGAAMVHLLKPYDSHGLAAAIDAVRAARAVAG
ncbi:hybrid sensor histidine kinase/response regulator [Azospirillum picis]|uniref:histidine kinase n=2 Tax=Azospirillum picis TaxID=488438 RepID=A0ABU0MJ73_9PROT|nr:response regulator [Azospirillum picis]MBP2299714.1 PAS domain S-box-containing protein [Azospirillum picis]MDQ0533510.1 PAS domain S-box-containing protein [Azospirillum picis]